MTTTLASPTLNLSPFTNEPYADFTQPENRRAMEQALQQVRSEFGRDYPLLIGGERITTGNLLKSVNPSHPTEVVGLHHKATPDLARRAVEVTYDYFPTWSETPANARIQMLVRAAEIIRRRKIEFDAWLVYEAGKTWPEAEADVAEAIDFCEYYAREMLRLAIAAAGGANCRASRTRWSTCRSASASSSRRGTSRWRSWLGMTTAALVTGNTVVVKPSSDTPTIAAKFAEVLLEAGFPPHAFSTAGRAAARRSATCSSTHPKTRFVSFTGSRDVGLRINELAAKHAARTGLDQARGRRDGRQGRHHRRRRGRPRQGRGGRRSRRPSASRGRSARPARAPSCDETVYDEFLDKLEGRRSKR